MSAAPAGSTTATGPRARLIQRSGGSCGLSPRGMRRHTPGARTGQPSAPISAGWPAGSRLAASRAHRPAGLPGRPRRGTRSVLRRPAPGGHSVVPSLGDTDRSRPGRPVGLDHLAAPAAPPPRVLEVEQMDRLSPPSTRTRRATGAGPGPGRAPRWRSRCGTGRSSRPRMRPGLRISELASADLGSLDLRRGEIRVMGKGRKERIGLLGSPRDTRWRPTSSTAGRSSPSEGRRRSRPGRDLPEPPRRPARRPRPALPARPSLQARRTARRGLAAHAPPLVRDAPARWRRGPARRPGAARSREPRDDPDLHPRLAGTAPGGISGGAPEGASRPQPVSGGRALARAGLIVSGAFLVSRVLGYVRLVVIGNTFGASPELDAFFAAFRLPT